MQDAVVLDEVFTGNRAAGRIALSVVANGGVTRRRQVYEAGPLRVRFPNSSECGLETMIVNTAGGIAGGDRYDVDIAVGDGATLGITSAAAEKVYRTLGPDAEIAIKLAVGAGARLSWLPHETILFDRARLRRCIEVDLAAYATLMMAEAVVFGRSAMGEVVEHGAFNDRWRVRRNGQLVFAEGVRLHGAIAEMLAKPAVAGGNVAIGTVLAVPGDAAMIERARAQSFCGEVGLSAWNGLAVVRLCDKDGEGLRRDLVTVIHALGGTLPRLWLN